EKSFPIEQFTQLDPLFDIGKLPREHTAEVSRLLIVRRFHRRRGDNEGSDKKTIVEDRETNKARRFPHPILALVVGLMRMSVKNNVFHWLSVMDPSLNRLLGLYGLQFDAVGPLTNYHGPRRPYHLDLIKMLDRMYKNHNQIWELLTDYGRTRPIIAKNTLNPQQVHNDARER
ncbi:MAG: PEP-CTERM/exosortase system-associated acyltransferase, partial [Nitrosospira sp.]